jgi:hypothetical protein
MPFHREVAVMNRTYEIRFQSLFNEGRGLSFPCDEQGNVLLDALSERARENYLYARAVVGREYAYPKVRRTWSWPEPSFANAVPMPA